MKLGSRVRFFATLLAILVATAGLGYVTYQTTFETLRTSYRQLLERSVSQGTYLIERYLDTQFTLLSLYASVPSVQQGQFPDLPSWLLHPGEDATSPKRLSIIDTQGQAWASTGQHFFAGDRQYFRTARAGKHAIEGPLTSRVDGLPVVVLAEPIPGGHARAAVLTSTIDLGVLRSLLGSVQGISGAEFTLSDKAGNTLATTAGPQRLGGSGIVDAVSPLTTVAWTLSAQVRVSDLLQPVKTILLLVGVLIISGVGLIVVFFLTGLRHRTDLEQVREDRTQALRDAYEQIRKLAYHDTVTRLPNRNLVVRRLGEALQSRKDLRVIVVAISKFRGLTTTFGLHFGDTVLREAAARLVSVLPPDGSGFLGRLEGNEFILLIEEALLPADMLSLLLDEFRAPMGQEDLRLHINVHVGSCRLLEAGTTAEEVIKSAETALWEAKKRGPHEASELTDQAVEARRRRAELQSRLPEALARGELDVHFQPQIDLALGTVAGYEALLRWTSPDLGSVSPVEFVPVAEETGFIVPLGFWVLERGMAFALALRERGTPATVSVNVSPVQFLHHEFLEEVGRRITHAGLEPSLLGLEITESTLMEGLDQLRPSLEAIMAKGVKIGLDDFGTGYSSLNYLKELPLNVLKIDRSFIAALGTDNRSHLLIAAIITLAHHLGLVVVAEGVETPEQLTQVREVGCDLVQGFETGRAQPAAHWLSPGP